MAVDCEQEGNGANGGIEEDIIKLYIIRITLACHFGKFMHQDCVNISGGTGLFGACLAASPSAARCQSTKGTHKVCLYTYISFCNRVAHAKSQGAHKGRPYNGTRIATGSDTLTVIRFRQQLSVSTSGLTLILERQGPCLRARRFPLITKRPSCQRGAAGFIAVNNSLCSGLIFSPVRMAFCNRAAHINSKGAHKGRPYSRARLATGRIQKRTDPFSSTTPALYLWKRSDPRA